MPGSSNDAGQGVAEARLTPALSAGLPLPSGGEMASTAGLSQWDWVRRVGSAPPPAGTSCAWRLERFQDILGQYGRIYYLLISMDYPAAITAAAPDLGCHPRHPRSGRGDLTVTLIQDAALRLRVEPVKPEVLGKPTRRFSGLVSLVSLAAAGCGRAYGGFSTSSDAVSRLVLDIGWGPVSSFPL